MHIARLKPIRCLALAAALFASGAAHAIDNDWYHVVPQTYSSANIVHIEAGNICEIRHSAAAKVLGMLETESFRRLSVAGARTLAGPCYVEAEGKTPYLIRAVTVGPEITAAYYEPGRIITLSMSMREMVELPPDHREHTPVLKTALIVNLDEPPLDVVPSLLLYK